ncbi:hypothetical protein B296_00029953 [Ensete ventricosum]|uniref:Uncharacterized protein n=1 Tax=Ensete ventricosum TaxID=4639 RepID=A0A426XF27_ENSVE|nr:hypothetical protein B296_00029953 [Ensete ventricosum]
MHLFFHLQPESDKSAVCGFGDRRKVTAVGIPKAEPSLPASHPYIFQESSSANPSLGVYYGDATGAVPFLWESRPGTPKNTVSNTTLPPLTPPPSSFPSPRHDGCKKSTKTSLIHTLLPRLTLKLFRKPSSSSSKTDGEESRYGSPT